MNEQTEKVTGATEENQTETDSGTNAEAGHLPSSYDESGGIDANINAGSTEEESGEDGEGIYQDGEDVTNDGEVVAPLPIGIEICKTKNGSAIRIPLRYNGGWVDMSEDQWNTLLGKVSECFA